MESLADLAAVIAQRNDIDQAISQIIGCPAHTGHVAEFIAAAIFELDLMPTANHKHFDGTFSEGPLKNQTINVKYRGRHYGGLNMGTSQVARNHPDWYLVLAGPTSKPASSKRTTTPWAIDQVFLLNSRELLIHLNGKRPGISTSLPKAVWKAAMLFPEAASPHYQITEKQRSLLTLFRSASSEE